MQHFEIQDEGTVVIVTPLTDTAKQWVDENVQLEAWQWMGDGFACEPRMVQDLIDAFEGSVLISDYQDLQREKTKAE